MEAAFDPINPLGFKINEYILIYESEIPGIFRYDGEKLRKVKFRDFKGILHRHPVTGEFLPEVICYLDALHSPEIHIVLVSGVAGSGKNYLAQHAQLQHIKTDKMQYGVYLKNLVEAGPRLGFFPGNKDEKMENYIEAYRKTMEKLGYDRYTIENWFREGILSVEPLSLIRGVTFDDSFLILDEAQNTDLVQFALAGSRMGINSKFVAIGDPLQVDGKYDGFTRAIQYFGGKQKRVAVVHLPTSLRSEGAELFAKFAAEG